MKRRKDKKKKEKVVEYGTAVYFQRTKAIQEEFKLIGAVTEREEYVRKLESVIRDVKEERRDCDDDTILETFLLFNQVRAVTIKVIKAIAKWQDSFTRQLLPIIFQGDYILEKLLTYINFINASKLRKIFNFQFFRFNPLLLPFPNLAPQAPIKVSPALGKEIRDFAYPNEDEIVIAYQILLNCLPDEIYKNKLVSLDKWLIDPWTPRIWISNSNPDEKFFTASGKPKGAAEDEDEDEDEDIGAKGKSKLQKVGGLTVRVPSKKQLPPIGKPTTPKSVGNSRATTPKGRAISPSNRSKSGESPIVMKRRNQLVPQQAEKLKVFTNLSGLEDVINTIEQEKLEELEEIKRAEEKIRKEMDVMDDYCSNLEKQLLTGKTKRTKEPLRNTNIDPTDPLALLSPDQFTKSAKLHFFHVTSDGSTIVDEEGEEFNPQLLLKDDGTSIAGSTTASKQPSVEGKSKETGKKDGVQVTDGATKLEEGKNSKEKGGLDDDEVSDIESKEDASEADANRLKEEEEKMKLQAEMEDTVQEIKKIPKLTKSESRKMSDLTVTFSVNGEENEKSSKFSSPATSRKPSLVQSNASTPNYKKTLSKIKVSTTFMREWYKVQNK